jgi:cyclic pyranopterin phosphate synthase
VIDYLRLSVTDRCNFRCVYCMPEAGVEWRPHEQVLSFEEMLRICRVMAGLGIRKVKVTGGEPLVRKGTAEFAGRLKSIPGIEQVTLTTNGFFLGENLPVLAEGKIDGINISLDALDPAVFREITRGGDVQRVLDAIDRALALGFPLKINCVPVRGLNENDLAGIASIARDRDISVRFIELMPLGDGRRFGPVSGAETAALIRERLGAMEPAGLPGEKPGNGPAKYYRIEGFRGRIGFINPMSAGFCGECNRLRLTSLGRLMPCLASETGLDLKACLRGDDEALARSVCDLVSRKPERHALAGSVYGAAGTAGGGNTRGMFRIGG